MKTKSTLLLSTSLGIATLILSTTIPLIACSSSKINEDVTDNDNNFTFFDQSKANAIAFVIVTKTQSEVTSIENLRQQLTNYFGGNSKVSSIDITNNPSIPRIAVSNVVINFNNSVNFDNQSFDIISPISGQLIVNGSKLTFTPSSSITTGIENGEITFDVDIPTSEIEYNQKTCLVSIQNVTSMNSNIKSYKYEWYVKRSSQSTFSLMPNQNTDTLTLQANDENIINNSYKVKVIATENPTIFVEKEIPNLVDTLNITYDLSTQPFNDGALNIPSCVTKLNRSNYTNDNLKTNPPTSLNFGENSHLKIIDNCSFYGCSNLTGSLILPNSVISVGDKAFESCIGLTSLVLNDGLEKIGVGAFYNWCNLYGKLIIPGSVKIIGACAFAACSRISSLILNEGIEVIDDNAFDYDSGLIGTLEIPSSVKKNWYLCFSSL